MDATEIVSTGFFFLPCSCSPVDIGVASFAVQRKKTKLFTAGKFLPNELLSQEMF